MRNLVFIICCIGCVLACWGSATDSRLSTNVYAVMAGVQLAAIVLHLRGSRFLSAVFGFAMTLIFIIAVLVEWTPDLHFRSVFSENVYQPTVIAGAYHALLLSTSLFYALTLHFLPSRRWLWGTPDPVERQLARKLLRFGIVLTPIAFLLSQGAGLITSGAYSIVTAQTDALITSPGFSLLAIYLVVVTMIAAGRLYELHDLRFMRVVIFCGFLVFFFHMMRGDRGTALVFFATVGVLYFQKSSGSLPRRCCMLLGCTLALFLLFETWGHVRVHASEMGLLASIVDGWQTEIIGAAKDGFDPLDITLLPQSYWHLLHGVDLYDTGQGLDGYTIYGLIPQAVPSAIANAVGLERPLNSAWLLGEYGRVSGGGMFIIGEGYWNFGLAGAGLVAGWTAVCCIAFERWVEKHPPLLSAAYFGYLGTFGFSIYYGLQPNFRALQISVVIALFMRYLLRQLAMQRNTSEAILKQRSTSDSLVKA